MEICDSEVQLSEKEQPLKTPQHQPPSSRSSSSRRRQFLGVFVEPRESSRKSSTTSPPLHAIVKAELPSSQGFNLSGSDSESDSVIAPRMHSRAASRAVLAAKSRRGAAPTNHRSPSTLDRVAVASDEDSDQTVFDNLVPKSTSAQKRKESSLRQSPIRPKEEEEDGEGDTVVPDVLPRPFAFPAFQAPSLLGSTDREGSMESKGADIEDHDGALPTPAATTTNPSSTRGTSSAPNTPNVTSPPVFDANPPISSPLEAPSIPSASILPHSQLTTNGPSDPAPTPPHRAISPELGVPTAGPSRSPLPSPATAPVKVPAASLKIRLKIKPVLPKLANATCHHDKSRNTRPKMSCINYPTCKALWCDRCVNLHYSGPDDPPFVADESFLCPVCRGACLCAKCRRNRSRSSVVHAVVEQQEEEQVGEPKVRTKRVVKKKREVVIEEGVEESAVKKGKRRRVEVVQVVEAPVVTRSTSWREGASEWIPVGAAEASLSAASSDFDAEDDSDFDDWGEGGAGGGPPSRTEPGLDDLPIQMPVEVQIVKGPIVWHEGPERRRRRTLLVNEEEKVGVGDTLASEVEAAEVEAVFDELLVEHAAAQDQEDVKPYIRPPPDSFDALLHFDTHPHFDVFTDLDPLRRSDPPPQHFELYDTLPPFSSPPPVIQPIPRHHPQLVPTTIFPTTSSVDPTSSYRRVPTPRFGMTGATGAATILVDAALPTFHHLPYTSRSSSLPYTSSVVTSIPSREHLRTSPSYDRLGAQGGYGDLGGFSDAALGSAVRKALRSGPPPFFDQSTIHLSHRPLTPTFHRPLDRPTPVEPANPASSPARHSPSTTRSPYPDSLVESLSGGGVAVNPYRNAGLRDAPMVVDVDETQDGGLLAFDEDQCALMDTLVYEKVYRVEGGNLRWAEEEGGWGEFGGGAG